MTMHLVFQLHRHHIIFYFMLSNFLSEPTREYTKDAVYKLSQNVDISVHLGSIL